MNFGVMAPFQTAVMLKFMLIVIYALSAWNTVRRLKWQNTVSSLHGPVHPIGNGKTEFEAIADLIKSTPEDYL